MQARQYMPEVGRFQSADRYEAAGADMNLVTDPLTQNRYAFAGGNPVGNVDWDGHEPASSFYTDPSYCGSRCGGDPRSTRSQRRVQRGQARTGYRRMQRARVGSQVNTARARGQVRAPGGCRSDAGCGQGYAKPRPAPMPKAPAGQTNRSKCLVGVPGTGCHMWQKAGEENPFHRGGMGDDNDNGTGHAILDGLGMVPGAGELADALNAAIYAGEGDYGNAAISLGGLLPVGGQLFTGARQANRGKKALQEAPSPKRGPNGGSSLCGRNSFTGRTPVRLANGKSKPISRIRPGDQVLTTDPKTGQTSTRRVQRLIVGRGRRRMIDIRVGDRTLSATNTHPLWVESRGEWIDAEEVRKGDILRSPTGSPEPVGSVEIWVDEDATVYNLTVEGVHTYYAGAEPVLVHNANCDLDALSRAGDDRPYADPDLSRAGASLEQHAGQGKFPSSVYGSSSTKSSMGQEQLDDILTAPGTARKPVQSGNFKGGTRFVAPDGRGVTFGPDGRFGYFGTYGAH